MRVSRTVVNVTIAQGILMSLASASPETSAAASAVPAAPPSTASSPESVATSPLTLPEATQRANQGDPEAGYAVGLHLALQGTQESDLAKARHYLGIAASGGDPRALNLLGLLTDPTWTPSPAASPQGAAEFYGAAAAKGYDAATHNLNQLVERNLITADQARQLRTPVMTASSSETDRRDMKERSAPTPLASSSGLPPAPVAFSAKSLNADKVPLTKDTEDNTANPESIFSRVAPAVVELKSPDNYGSGVILGTLKASGQDFTLQTGSETFDVNLNFAKDAGPLALDSSDEDHLLIVTNAHVTGRAKSLHVGLGLKGEAESYVNVPADHICASLNAQEDLAFVLVRRSSIPPGAEKFFRSLKFYRQKNPPAKGAVVFAIGNPEGLTRTITQGLYNGVRPEGIQFDAAISVGSSGGALVEEQGELLGITSGFVASDNSQNLNFALPSFQVVQNLQLGQSLCRPLPRS